MFTLIPQTSNNRFQISTDKHIQKASILNLINLQVKMIELDNTYCQLQLVLHKIYIKIYINVNILKNLIQTQGAEKSQLH